MTSQMERYSNPSISINILVVKTDSFNCSEIPSLCALPALSICSLAGRAYLGD